MRGLRSSLFLCDKREVTEKDIETMISVVKLAGEIDRNMDALITEIKAENERYDAVMTRIRSGK